MLEGLAGEPLRLMRLIDPEKIIEAPPAVGGLRLTEDPATAQPPEAVELGEAIGRDEFRAKVHTALPRRHCGVEIALVDQHARTGGRRELAQSAEFRFLRERAAGVVEIGDDDQPRPATEHPLDCCDIETK